jgi:2,4-didehydro-3-deoxy-L-rhamnonate hydrolase
MQLMRIGESGAERPVVRVNNSIYVDVTERVGDFDEAFFRSGALSTLPPFVEDQLSIGRYEHFRGERIGAPIARPHQIVCVGLNYSDHARETGQPVPDEPILFTKAPNTLVGPDDNIVLPRGSTKTDWEVELGVVIGRRTSYVSAEQATASIAGYLVVNDVSERSFQLERGGQWVKGKSAETFNPAGPWLVTPEEVPDVSDLEMWLDVNDMPRQRGSTSTMIFSPAFIVHYVSQFLVLEPGDLINTGTPPGVGLGLQPPVWLQPGDTVTLGIRGLGNQRQKVVSARSDSAVEMMNRRG